MSAYYLAQSASTVPTKGYPIAHVYGVTPPVSSPTIPSVYNKKLSKLFRGRLVVFDQNDTIRNALRIMSNFNISSAPVINKADRTILGFVDMLDFLAYLFKISGVEVPESGQPLRGSFDISSRYDNFMDSPVSAAVNLSNRDPFVVLHGDLSMSEAIEGYFKKGIHRIAITDDSGDVIGVVSQWTIINYLATVPTEDKQWLPALRTYVGDYPYKTDKVLAVDRLTSTLDVFLHMHKKNLSAVGVLDENGKLCGNLSASDLKGWCLFEKDLRDLNKRVVDFLGVIRKFQGRPVDFAVTVTPNTLMEDAIWKLNKEIVHRAYVVDNERNPIGVLSLTDIMKAIVVDLHTEPAYARAVTAQGEVRAKPIIREAREWQAKPSM